MKLVGLYPMLVLLATLAGCDIESGSSGADDPSTTSDIGAADVNNSGGTSGSGGAGESGAGGDGGGGAIAPVCAPSCGCHIGPACYVGTSPHRCGANGNPCQTCPAGQACVDGACADAVPACSTDSECDDTDPCTTDVCGEGQCYHMTIMPQSCALDGWCNVGAVDCGGKVACCHGCLLLQDHVFACVQDCPSPSFCSKDGLCVL